jgi:hypothetical protein
MNAADVKAKLATANGRADLLSKSTSPTPESLRELYLAAFAREPRQDELKIAEAYLAKPRSDKEGKPLDAERSRRQAYEDLLWALMNTKEFRYNH